MPDDKTQQQETQEKDTDERGVPLLNKLKELERKFQDKDNELAFVRQELAGIKTSIQEAEREEVSSPTGPPDVKAKLMEFVQDPDEWYAKKRAAEENERVKRDFQTQIPEAESWIKGQSGYAPEDDARIYQIINENKLNTPYHLPMERAKTAWKILKAEKHEKETSMNADEHARQAAIRKTSTESAGKATPPQPTLTREDIIEKLAVAEKKGDFNAATKYISMLEDVR